jgi:hypothetical protein
VKHRVLSAFSPRCIWAFVFLFVFCLHLLFSATLYTLMAWKTFVCNGAESELQSIVLCHRLRNAPLLIVVGPVAGSVSVAPVTVLSSVCPLNGSCQSLYFAFWGLKIRKFMVLCPNI